MSSNRSSRLARRDVQRAVAHRHAVGLVEAAGDDHDALGLVVAVTIDDGVDLARVLRSDEDRPFGPEHHRPGVLHLLGEHGGLESRR